MSPSAKRPSWVRMKLQVRSVDAFVEKFASRASKRGIFLATRSPRTVGTVVRFELSTSDGKVRLLKGDAVVTLVGEEGMTLKFTRLDESSQAVIDRLETHRREIAVVDEAPLPEGTIEPRAVPPDPSFNAEEESPEDDGAALREVEALLADDTRMTQLLERARQVARVLARGGMTELDALLRTPVVAPVLDAHEASAALAGILGTSPVAERSVARQPSASTAAPPPVATAMPSAEVTSPPVLVLVPPLGTPPEPEAGPGPEEAPPEFDGGSTLARPMDPAAFDALLARSEVSPAIPADEDVRPITVVEGPDGLPVDDVPASPRDAWAEGLPLSFQGASNDQDLAEVLSESVEVGPSFITEPPRAPITQEIPVAEASGQDVEIPPDPFDRLPVDAPPAAETTVVPDSDYGAEFDAGATVAGMAPEALRYFDTPAQEVPFEDTHTRPRRGSDPLSASTDSTLEPTAERVMPGEDPLAEGSLDDEDPADFDEGETMAVPGGVIGEGFEIDMDLTPSPTTPVEPPPPATPPAGGRRGLLKKLFGK